MNKIDYNLEFKKELARLGDKKPTLLLHTCCAVCAAGVLGREFLFEDKQRILSDFFDITLYFYNPNIDTVEEYFKRASEVERLIVGAVNDRPPCNSHTIVGLLRLAKTGRTMCIPYSPADIPVNGRSLTAPTDIALIIDSHIPNGQYNIAPLNCNSCIEHRLEETALKAQSLNFDYFTTTLSVSPHKDSALINELGKKIAAIFSGNLKFLSADFKKENGFLTANKIASELKLYRQSYCGCIN